TAWVSEPLTRLRSRHGRGVFALPMTGQPRARHGSMGYISASSCRAAFSSGLIMRIVTVVFCLLMLWGASHQARADDPWMMLPPTRSLPQAAANGYAPVNGIKIWYAEFGQGEPVIMLHGGLGNSNYWGLQVPALAKSYRVIVMDSRGHGRSTRND